MQRGTSFQRQSHLALHPQFCLPTPLVGIVSNHECVKKWGSCLVQKGGKLATSIMHAMQGATRALDHGPPVTAKPKLTRPCQVEILCWEPSGSLFELGTGSIFDLMGSLTSRGLNIYFSAQISNTLYVCFSSIIMEKQLYAFFLIYMNYVHVVFETTVINSGKLI